MLKNFVIIFLILIGFIKISFADDFSQIGTIKLPQEEGTLFSTNMFLEPNEPEANYYYKALKNNDGTLVAVGTLRGLIDIGLGNFTHAILMDANVQALNFNRFLLKLIQNINSEIFLSTKEKRMRFLELLTGNYSKKTSLKYFLLRNKKLNEPDYIKKWLKSIDEFACTIKNNKKYKRLAKGIKADLKIDQICKQYFGSIYKKSLLKFYTLRKNDELYFWEDDNQWSKIAQMIENGSIAIMGGAIPNETSFAHLTKLKNELDSPISCLDLSNIPDYDNIDKLEIINVIRGLKLNGNSKILFTIRKSGSNANVVLNNENIDCNTGHVWIYCSLDSKNIEDMSLLLNSFDD